MKVDEFFIKLAVWINVVLFVLAVVGFVFAFFIKSPLFGLMSVLFAALFGAFVYHDFVLKKKVESDEKVNKD
jgi:undecaprenyl pyrophosphate phosphatase UppP